MTGRGSQFEGDDDVLMRLDISRPHLFSQLVRVVFVTIDGKSLQFVSKQCVGCEMPEHHSTEKVLDAMNLMGVSLESSCSGLHGATM